MLKMMQNSLKMRHLCHLRPEDHYEEGQGEEKDQANLKFRLNIISYIQFSCLFFFIDNENINIVNPRQPSINIFFLGINNNCAS